MQLVKLHISIIYPLTHTFPSLPTRHLICTSRSHIYTTAKMELRNLILLAVSLFTFSVHAQFGFFDQMFGGGGHQHQQQQQQQNVRSDSQWYQSQYENGMLL